jgi:hypothetical protein
MSWDVGGANSVIISPYPGQVAGSGAIAISPGVTSYFSLTATNDFGSSHDSATVSVYPYAYYNYPTPNPIIVPFSNEEEKENELPNSAEERNENLHIVTPPVVAPPPPHQGQGSGDGGRMPRIEAFSSSPSNINPGNSAQLQWRTNGATSVNISPNIGSVPPSGTMTVAPNHTTNYKITVSNSAGVIEHTQEVTVPRSMQPKDARGSENITR